MKILAVDDSSIVRDMLSSLCSKLGYGDLHTASSGEEALNALRSENTAYDCLLMDINMTGISGIELCAAVRTMPRYVSTPIIMLTSLRDREFVDGAFKAGATDYVTKPFVVSDLSECLMNAQALIDAHRLQLSMADEDENISFYQEIHLPGFKDIVRYNALGKYLARMSSVGLRCSQIIAIKIDEFEDLCTRASLDELQYALCEVADAICDALVTQGNILSYRGEGIFVVIMGMGHISEAIELEDQVQDVLDQKSSAFDDGSEMDLEVSVGTPIQPLLQSDNAAGIVFARSIARAHERHAQKRTSQQTGYYRPG